MKLYYPAVFISYKTGFTVEFPDLPGCVTQGDTIEEAIEMAADAACGWILTSIEDGEDIPPPSPINTILVYDGFANYVVLDIDEYAKIYSVKAVKKTLTIPEWLNCLAERRGINFSRELQHALKARLGLTANVIEECVTTLRETTNTLSQLIPAISETFKQDSSCVTKTATTSSKTIVFPSLTHIS